jgi:hypothetical protein
MKNAEIIAILKNRMLWGFFLKGAGKTAYLLSASFRDGNIYIWQAILT